MQNGEPNLLEEIEEKDFGFKTEDEVVTTLKPQDILQGFDKVSMPAKGDEGSPALLRATAEMLIKTTLYPASFERQRLKLETTIRAWPPSEETLNNVAEMIVHWVSK